MDDKFEVHRLRAMQTNLETQIQYLYSSRVELLGEIERYRKETERLQNLWYDALANQVFPPVQVQTIKMNVGE